VRTALDGSIKSVAQDHWMDRELRGRSASIGFSAKVLAPEDRKVGEIFREVEPEDLLKYGLIPEFVGRLPVVATLEDRPPRRSVSICRRRSCCEPTK
jgi:ATP-dependent protease Clp ATPase subunit